MRKQNSLKLLLCALLLAIGCNVAWGEEEVVYSTGFESSEGFTAATTYNNTDEAAFGPSNKQWKTYYGCATTNVKISGSQAMQMRVYSSMTAAPYTYTNFSVAQTNYAITKITFSAKTDGTSNCKGFKLQISTDGGSNWTDAKSMAFTSTSTHDFEYIPTSAITATDVRIKVVLYDYAVTSSSSKKFTIDDVKVYGESTASGPIDPTITPTDKTIAAGETLDVSSMFTSNSTGTKTYSIIATPEGAIDNDNYYLNGTEFYAELAGQYTVQLSQAAVANTYNAKTATATITVAAKKTVTITAPSNGTIVVKNGENTLSSGAEVIEGTQLQITATPNTGYKFSSWNITGATPASTTEKTTTVTVGASDVTIAANFEETTDITVTYNFNNKDAYPSGFPTSGTTKASAQHFTISGNDIIINANTGYYIINSTTENCGLFFGKTSNSSSKPQAGTSYLGFPGKYGYRLVKVVATSTNGIAGGLPLNIYDTQLNAVSTASNTVGSTKTAHTFVVDGAEGTEYWLTAGGTSGKNLQFDNIVLTYEKVNYHNLTISAAGYATFFDSEHAFTLPTGMTAYVWSDGLQEMYTSGVVPAGEPVVLKATAGNYTLNFTTSGAATYKQNDMNDLDGTDTETALTPDANYYFYGLSLNADNDLNSVGFYWMAEGGAAFTNGAHKAYLKLAKSSGAPARFLFNETEVTTEIENVAAETEVRKALINGQIMIIRGANMFDLNGRLVK